jgi:hypothetical protein
MVAASCLAVVTREGDASGDPAPRLLSAPSMASTYAARTRSVDRYVQYKSITGATVLDDHFTINWTYNGVIITGAPLRGHYLRTSAPSVYDRGFTSNTAYPSLPGPYAYTVNLQANWHQCILKYGCIASGNPYTQFGVYFDGTYHIVLRQ